MTNIITRTKKAKVLSFMIVIALLLPLFAINSTEAKASSSVDIEDLLSGATLTDEFKTYTSGDTVSTTTSLSLNYEFEISREQAREIYTEIDKSYVITLPTQFKFATGTPTGAVTLYADIETGGSTQRMSFGELTANISAGTATVQFGGEFWDTYYASGDAGDEVALTDGYLFLQVNINTDTVTVGDYTTIRLPGGDLVLLIESRELGKKGSYNQETGRITWEISYTASITQQMHLKDIISQRTWTNSGQRYVPGSMKLYTNGTYTKDLTPSEFVPYSDTHDEFWVDLGIMQSETTYTVIYDTVPIDTYTAGREVVLSAVPETTPNINARISDVPYSAAFGNSAALYTDPSDETPFIQSKGVTVYIEREDRVMANKTGVETSTTGIVGSETVITWTVNINTLNQYIEDFEFRDRIASNQTYVDGSMTLNGSPYTPGISGQTLSVPLATEKDKVIEYEIVFQTKATIEYDTEFWSNPLTLVVDGRSTTVTCQIPATKETVHDAFTKTGEFNLGRGGNATWSFVTYENLPEGNIIDDLNQFSNPWHSYVPGSFTVTDADGTPIASDAVTLTSTDDNKVIIHNKGVPGPHYFQFETSLWTSADRDIPFGTFNASYAQATNTASFDGEFSGVKIITSNRVFIGSPDMIGKFMGFQDYWPDNTVHVIFNVNGFGVPLTGATIRDVLPDGWTLVPGTIGWGQWDKWKPEDGLYEVNGQELIIHLGDLLDNERGEIRFEITPSDEILMGRLMLDPEYPSGLVNTVYLERDTYADESDQATSYFGAPNLSKFAQFDRKGGKIDYRVEINNYGVDLGEYSIKDSYSEGLELDEDSIVMYYGRDDAAGGFNWSGSYGAIVNPSLYKMTHDPENRTFSIQMPEGEGRYSLRYSLDITKHASTYRNDVVYVGGLLDETTQGTNTVAIGGGARGTKYVPIRLTGTKVVEGLPYELKAGDFTFDVALKSGDTDFVEMPDDASATNKADGTFEFTPIILTEDGTYEFTVTERAGSIEGMKYNQTPVNVKVVVTFGVPTITYNDKSDMTITNTFGSDTPVDLSLTGAKIMDGSYLMQGDDFEFVLSEPTPQSGVTMPDITKTTNTVTGDFGFAPITFEEEGTFEFEITEVIGSIPGMTYVTDPIAVSVSIIKDGDELIVDHVTYNAQPELLIVNRYTDPEPTSYQIVGQKLISGDYAMKAGDFTFDMIGPADAGVKMPSSGTVTINAAGQFAFDAIGFDKAGTFVFTVTERPGDIKYMSYDTSPMTVTITVTDVNHRFTVTDVTYSTGTRLEVTNTYTPPGDPTPVTFKVQGNKHLIGDTYTPTSGEFEFTLAQASAQTGVTMPSPAKVNASEAFEFGNITFTKAGTFTFTVTETEGSVRGMTYNTAPVIVTVTVTHNEEDNTLNVSNVVYSSGDTLSITNTYDNPDDADLIITGLKSVDGDYTMSEGEFSFNLHSVTPLDNVDMPSTLRVSNNANGSFAFDKITFSKEGSYTFTVTETLGSTDYMKYDTEPVTIQVEVVYDGNDYVVSSTTYSSGTHLTIVNEYKVPEPATFTLTGEKIVEGDSYDIEGDEFAFTLSGASENMTLPEVLTVTADEMGMFTFGDITFTEAGTYELSISEEPGTIRGMSYETAPVDIIVTVALVGSKFEVTDVAYGEASQLTITNTYELPEPVTFTPEGLKVVTGSEYEIEEGDFEFVLSGETLDEDLKATNTSSGAFVFDTLTFDKEGSYEFTITETEGEIEHMTYSDKIISLIVDVEYSVEENQYVVISASYDNDENLEVENIYSVPTPEPVPEEPKPEEPKPEDPKPEDPKPIPEEPKLEEPTPELVPEEPKPEPPKPAEKEIVKTGETDNSIIYVVLTLLSLTALAGIALVRRRSQREN